MSFWSIVISTITHHRKHTARNTETFKTKATVKTQTLLKHTTKKEEQHTKTKKKIQKEPNQKPEEKSNVFIFTIIFWTNFVYTNKQIPLDSSEEFEAKAGGDFCGDMHGNEG